MSPFKENQTITVQAALASDAKKAWDCYTQPHHITQWNFADPSWHCPHAENDLRKGGTYCARMEAKDGSFGFDFEAIYDEVVPYEKLLFTIADGRKVAVLFSPTGSETTVTVTFEAETQNSVDLQKKGWQAILDHFRDYVASL